MIPHDKALHIIAGASVFALANLFGLDYAIAAVVLAAFGREAFNWYEGGKFDWLDISATLGGGLIGFICTLKL